MTSLESIDTDTQNLQRSQQLKTKSKIKTIAQAFFVVLLTIIAAILLSLFTTDQSQSHIILNRNAQVFKKNILIDSTIQLNDLSFNFKSYPKISANLTVNFDEIPGNSKILQIKNYLKFANFGFIQTNYSKPNDINGSSILINLKDVEFYIISGKENDFQDFLKKLALENNQDEFEISITGKSSLLIDHHQKIKSIESSTFNKTLSIKSAKGFQDKSAIIKGLDVIGGTSDSILLDIHSQIDNPASIGFLPGGLRFEMIYEGIKIGETWTSNAQLYHGTNDLLFKAILKAHTESSKIKIQQLLENYVNGKNQFVLLKGIKDTTDIKLIAPIVEKLNVNTFTPGKNIPSILGTRFWINFFTIAFTRNAKVGFDLKNIYDCPIEIIKFKGSVLHQKRQQMLGSAEMDFSNNPILIKSKEIYKSPPLNMKIHIDFNSLRSLAESHNHHLLVEIKSDVLMKIGDFILPMTYIQKDVPCEFKRP